MMSRYTENLVLVRNRCTVRRAIYGYRPTSFFSLNMHMCRHRAAWGTYRDHLHDARSLSLARGFSISPIRLQHLLAKRKMVRVGPGRIRRSRLEGPTLRLHVPRIPPPRPGRVGVFPSTSDCSQSLSCAPAVSDFAVQPRSRSSVSSCVIRLLCQNNGPSRTTSTRH